MTFFNAVAYADQLGSIVEEHRRAGLDPPLVWAACPTKGCPARYWDTKTEILGRSQAASDQFDEERRKAAVARMAESHPFHPDWFEPDSGEGGSR